MIYLHKILPILISPIFVCIALVVLGLLWKRKWPAMLGLLVLWMAATPLVGNIASAWIEDGQIRRDIASIDNADAIVVLSGMTTTVRGEFDFETEWGDPDRFFSGVELFNAQKAPLLVFTRGQLPWEGREIPEGEYLRLHAIQMGVPSESIKLTEEVQNTAQEASAVKKLFASSDGETAEIILVTSAFHMPRALALFENQGLAVQPFPVDSKVVVEDLSILSFLPRAGPLLRTSLAIREILGRQYYRARTLIGI